MWACACATERGHTCETRKRDVGRFKGCGEVEGMREGVKDMGRCKELCGDVRSIRKQ